MILELQDKQTHSQPFWSPLMLLIGLAKGTLIAPGGGCAGGLCPMHDGAHSTWGRVCWRLMPHAWWCTRRSTLPLQMQRRQQQQVYHPTVVRPVLPVATIMAITLLLALRACQAWHVPAQAHCRRHVHVQARPGGGWGGPDGAVSL